jgi:hypothetical protein
MVVVTTDVYGVFYDRALADRSFRRLLDAHFEEADVGLKDPGILGTKDLSHDRESPAGGSTAVVIASIAIGGILGLGAGLAVMSIPGIGPSLFAAPFLGALIGFGLGGAVGGAFDAIDATTVDEPGSRRYEHSIPEGGILLSVHCRDTDAVTRAEDLLRQSGAQAISHTGSFESAADIQTSRD